MTFASAFTAALSSGTISIASEMLTLRPRIGGGIIFAIFSTSPYGILSARPTSFIAARDPIAALVDFANLMNGRCGAQAGTFVTTGSWTGMVFTKRGARIVADFGPLGRVEVAFPADD